MVRGSGALGSDGTDAATYGARSGRRRHMTSTGKQVETAMIAQ